MEMGFVRGREVTVLLQAPLNDPIKYKIMNYEVSLRRSEAEMVEVEPFDNAGTAPDITLSKGYGTIEESDDIITQTSKNAWGEEELSIAVEKPDDEKLRERVRERHHQQSHTINVVLIGNPNCGKTSLFNDMTGGREHVGNYSGVTVDAKSGSLKYNGYTFKVVDLPGTYSLASYSPEELYVRKYLAEQVPDVIVNVIDGPNIERNLYLTTELIDMDRPMVIALNMFDELRREGSTIDYRTLGAMIGVPIVPTVSKTGEGKTELLDTIIDVFEGRHKDVRHIHVHLGPETEKAVTQLKNMIKQEGDAGHKVSPRYMAIKLLERDPETERVIDASPIGAEILERRDRLLEQLRELTYDEVSASIAAEKYGFIAGALTETMIKREQKRNSTGIIDRLVTNRYVGYPLFFIIMFITFWLTFTVGAYPMEWIQAGVDWLSSVTQTYLPDGPVKDLVADGIIGGVGGVIVFLPNILILYFCISFMEDSGYMARAAFIMDKVMHRIGLHGKSFIPLIMGFGCNVPAIMGSRAIESRSSRLITIMINPFMSCSARIPIFVLLAGVFFPEHATLVFFGMYLTGILVAVITARLLRRLWFKKDETPFVMELPPYRMPSMKISLRHTWSKGEQYIKKMGGIILVASIIVWALNYFPLKDKSLPADQRQDSYLEMAGKAITPVMEPCGFNWEATVSAMAGVPAKEIVVSTLGVLYTGDEAVSDASLGQRLKQAPAPGMSPGFTTASALAFMIFILLYCPCIATLTAIYRETGSWGYPAFSVIYNTLVAWVLAFATYQIALLL